MAISKFILNNEVQMNVTDTTAVAEDVAQNKYFYGADGIKTAGTSSGGGGWTPEQMAKREISGALDFGTATTIPNSLFDGCTGVTSITGNSVTTIGNWAFQNCPVTNVSMENVTSIGQYAFRGNAANFYFPNLTTLNVAGGYYFSYTNGGSAGGYALDLAIVLPALVTIGGDSFRANYHKYYDLGVGLSTLESRTFYMCARDSIVILRNPNQVVTASGTNPIAGIGSEWKVYVPSALLSSYQNDTNWSTKGNIFYAIEGSEFEHHYADGHPISQDPYWMLGYGVYINNNTLQHITPSATRAVYAIGSGEHGIPISPGGTSPGVESNNYPIPLTDNASSISFTVDSGFDIYTNIYALHWGGSAWHQDAQTGWTNSQSLTIPSGATHWVAAIRIGSAGTATVTTADTEAIHYTVS